MQRVRVQVQFFFKVKTYERTNVAYPSMFGPPSERLSSSDQDEVEAPLLLPSLHFDVLADKVATEAKRSFSLENNQETPTAHGLQWYTAWYNVH